MLYIKVTNHEHYNGDRDVHFIQCWNSKMPSFTTKTFNSTEIEVDGVGVRFEYLTNNYYNSTNAYFEIEQPEGSKNWKWYRLDFKLFDIRMDEIDYIETITRKEYHANVSSEIKERIRKSRTRSEWKRPRDMQKQKLYNAENVLRGILKYKTFNDTQARVDEITSSKIWEDLYLGLHRNPKHVTNMKIETRNGNGKTAWARSMAMQISLPNWAWDEAIILHELAHILHDAQGWDVKKNNAPHDASFARVFIILVANMWGIQYAKMLVRAFRNMNIEYKLNEIDKS